MSSSNHHSNLSRKPKMSVRQVWKRKTPPPKSSPTCHNDSPPPPPRNTPHSISPPMNYPQRDRIINQLHTISTLIDSQIPTPPSSPLSLVQPPTHAQVGCHASFCHCCRMDIKGGFKSIGYIIAMGCIYTKAKDYPREPTASVAISTSGLYAGLARVLHNAMPKFEREIADIDMTQAPNEIGGDSRPFGRGGSSEGNKKMAASVGSLVDIVEDQRFLSIPLKQLLNMWGGLVRVPTEFSCNEG
ncbi:hypothetical protein Tco_0339552 [Tanacetum coccineum]